jgi:GAF domain-containing protein
MATFLTSDFPFRRVLTLEPLIDYWRKLAEDSTSGKAPLARLVLEELEQAPALLAPLDDLELLQEHTALLELMLCAVIPAAAHERTFIMVCPALDLRPFYMTPALSQLLGEHPPDLYVNGHELMEIDMEEGRAMFAYHWILATFYGIQLKAQFPMYFRRVDPATGLEQFFRVITNNRFVRPVVEGELPPLSEADVQRLLADPLDLGLWRSVLPPERFSFHGIVVLEAIDVTVQETLSALKNDLLQKDALTTPERVDHLERRLRTLLQSPDLRLGLICLHQDQFTAMNSAHVVGRSLVLEDHLVPDCEGSRDSYYARAFESRTPIIVHDLNACTVCTSFERRLREQDYRNLLIAPLYDQEELVGLLELASPNPGDLNAMNAINLVQVASLFATAMKRTLEEEEDRLQALIKRTFTTLHPVVEWRFREAALQLMEMPDRKPSIVFPDVYPLYALSDIRGSSTHRNESIQADLLEQLGLALNVVVQASMARPLPALDELGYRIGKYSDEILSGIRTGDESFLLDFLHTNVEPLFEQLRPMGERVRERIDLYRQAIDPKLGFLYRQRRDFDESVTRINDTISAYIEEQEEEAQAMFPHYFEKFKTDGVDYNIYIGDALLEQESFHPIFLRNLRLWQLMTTCGVVWKLKALKPDLPMPLDTTHLILVQSQPISIRFREDEKRLDVDGAYNIRYEIIKKRIDKALVRNTRERLTQPGKIAIVYGQPKEGQEYRRYIDYLQAARYLYDEIEDLEVEELQGVSGLRALRVTVAEAMPGIQVNFSTEHLLEEA